MDLVSKQEMERQRVALQNANLRLEQLTQQVNMLEETLKNKNKHLNSALEDHNQQK